MQLPRDRGPISRAVIGALRTGGTVGTDLCVSRRGVSGQGASGQGVGAPPAGSGEVITDQDAQLALWTIYELHYRGFDGVADDLEWDLGLIRLRRELESRFEQELRAATYDRLRDVAADGDIAEQLLGLVAADDSPSPAVYLQRHATREQILFFLRERSIQQLKESDPQSFVLPRLDGSAKVALAELQYDEYGGGRPERLHARLYAEALQAAWLDPSYGAYIDEISATSLASANLMTMFGLNRRLRGAAMGHLAAFEASSSVPCRKIVGGIERVGLPDAVAAYFSEHVEADAVHEQVAAHDICGALVAEDPSLRAEVLFGAASCLHLDAVSGAELLARWTAELEEAS